MLRVELRSPGVDPFTLISISRSPADGFPDLKFLPTPMPMMMAFTSASTPPVVLTANVHPEIKVGKKGNLK